MTTKSFNAERQWGRAGTLYDERRFNECAEVIENIVKHTSDTYLQANYLSIKASVYIDGSNLQEANKELDRALVLVPNHFQSNYSKARLLYLAEGDLQTSLLHINNAIENYVPDTLEEFGETAVWVQTFINTRSEIYNLKTSIENDIRSNSIYDRMQYLEESVEKKLREERMRSIEIIGIFAAIIALLLATAQAAVSLKGPDFLWLGLGLVVPVGFLFFLITPKSDMKWKPVIVFVSFVVGCVVLGIFIDRWFIK
jgi:tetratricopeptide (TPR) repeat protein